MPEKRKDSPFYYVRRRNLPGYGDTGRISSRTTKQKIARDMERVIEDLAQKALVDPSWYVLLDAVCRDRKLTPADILKAKNTGTLDTLKISLNDPFISDAVAKYRTATNPQKAIRVGLEQLVKYTPAGSRLSYLRDARTITDLCYLAEKGDPDDDGKVRPRKRNSVRRYLLRSISLLLRYYWGNAMRTQIFADVRFPKEDDTREFHLTREEIGRLLDACEQYGGRDLAVMARMALQTSADRGVLLAGTHAGKTYRGLLVRDLNIRIDNQTLEYEGEAYLEDTKTTNRSRTVPLTDYLCRELLALASGKRPDDPVFNLSYAQMDFPWKRAKTEAGLGSLHFKDLRAQFSIYAEEADIPLTIVSRQMGHDDTAMTRRYQKRKTVMSQSQAQKLEAGLFGEGPDQPIKRAI